MSSVFNQLFAGRARPTDRPPAITSPSLPGFALCLQPNDRKVWVRRCRRSDGRLTKTAVGKFPAQTYTRASEFAKGIVRDDDDPQKGRTVEARTVAFADYLDDQYEPFLKAKSYHPNEMRQRLDCPDLRDQRLTETRADDLEPLKVDKQLLVRYFTDCSEIAAVNGTGGARRRHARSSRAYQ